MPSKFSWFFHGFPQFGHVHSPAHLISLLIYSTNKILKHNIFRTELLMPSSLSKPGLLISQVPHLSKWDLCPSSCPNPKPWSHLQLLLFLIFLYQFISSVIGSAFKFSSVQLLSHVWPHEPQHTKPLCPSPTIGIYPNSWSLRWWCHPTISSSVIPFSSCPRSFPASVSFQMSQLFASGGQSTRVSVSTSVLPMNTQD